MVAAGSVKKRLAGALSLCLILVEAGRADAQAHATQKARPAVAIGREVSSSASGLPNAHPEPKRVGGYSWHPPVDTVRPISGKRNNIFFV